MAKKKPSAKEQRKDIPEAQAKQDVLRKYGRDTSELDPSTQQFSFTLERPDLNDVISLDDYIESVEWDDGDASGTDAVSTGSTAINEFPALTGTLTLRKPHPDAGKAPVVHTGHMLRCAVRWDGEWTPLWAMRLGKPSLQYADGSWAWELGDDLNILALNLGDFSFKAGHKVKANKRKRGWKANTITKRVAKQFRFPVEHLAPCQYYIKDLTQDDASPLSIVRQAYQLERENTARRFVISWRPTKKYPSGALQVATLRHNPTLYILREQITQAVLEAQPKGNFCTALLVRGTLKGKGKEKGKSTKIAIVVPHKRAIEKYGYIQKTVDLTGLDSRAEAIKRGKRILAKRTGFLRTVQLDHTGIAFVRRGDAITISLPEEGYYQRLGLVWVLAASHRVSSGEYTMSLTMTFEDPLDANQIRKDKNALARKNKRDTKKKK